MPLVQCLLGVPSNLGASLLKFLCRTARLFRDSFYLTLSLGNLFKIRSRKGLFVSVNDEPALLPLCLKDSAKALKLGLLSSDSV